MKKYIILFLLVLAIPVLSRADPIGSIILSGTVGNNTTVTVSSVAGFNALDITTGFSDQVVANILEKSNSNLGYTVTLNSLNAGATAVAVLKGTGANTDTVPYTLKYNNAAVTLVAGSALVTSSSIKTPNAGLSKALSVSIAGIGVSADTYSDTVTLTIATN